ncbi:MAG: hypothetical protein JWR12_1774 [Mucilaginibacter sp.]|jgi:hypothetical protein|nr:hypothetical protein [Mucilaginibacter sp.]
MRKSLFIWLIIIGAASCKKLVNPPAITAPNSYLVVDGNITIGDSTAISLSRTVNISGNAKSNAELNAKVYIEGSQDGSYSLTSKNNGTYVAPPINLSASQNYRLKIITSDGRQYASDFVPVKNSPPIDSVNYVIKTDGLNINVNTHDAANNTHYYRWEYNETYIIHSAFESHYMEVNHDTTALRPADQEIYQCWVSDTSSVIFLGSSAKLSKDIISSQTLIPIPSASEKIHIRYSVLVKQYALTTDAYNYYTQLKQITEKIGGIFDPQPSELTGNVHCLSNPAEPVIGYITAGAFSQSRIFIDNMNLPQWIAQTPYMACTVDTLLYIRPVYFANPTIPPIADLQVHDLIYTGIEIPIDKVGDYPKGGFTAEFPRCADCTLRGTNKQPPFWK